MNMKKLKKEKKLSKLIKNYDSDSGDNSEHELSYYIKDRVQLMKEVLKIIKPRKIISMAPECMKNMDKDEINSILLEELLGISNKRLKYIFEGKSLDEESSSSEDDQAIDVISLDDISDDDFINISDEEDDTNTENHKRKYPKDYLKKVKKEKVDKPKNSSSKKNDNTKYKNKPEKQPMDEENLMSVLELLELQARARAIKSQLELENRKKKQEKEKQEVLVNNKLESNNDDDEVIMEVPKEEEIVITSSDSENDDQSSKQQKLEGNSSIITENISNKSKSSEVVDKKVLSDLQSTSFNTVDKSNQNEHLQDTNTKTSELTNMQCHDNNHEPANSSDVVKQIPTKGCTYVQTSSDYTPKATKDQNTKKSRHIINRYQSYKKDLTGDNTLVKPAHSNIKQHRPKESVEETDDLVINIDQDDFDCIVCD